MWPIRLVVTPLRGSWYLVRGTWCEVRRCPSSLERRRPFIVVRTRSLVATSVLGTLNPEPGTWNIFDQRYEIPLLTVPFVSEVFSLSSTLQPIENRCLCPQAQTHEFQESLQACPPHRCLDRRSPARHRTRPAERRGERRIPGPPRPVLGPFVSLWLRALTFAAILLAVTYIVVAITRMRRKKEAGKMVGVAIVTHHVADNPHERAIFEIFDLAELDYGRVDRSRLTQRFAHGSWRRRRRESGNYARRNGFAHSAGSSPGFGYWSRCEVRWAVS